MTTTTPSGTIVRAWTRLMKAQRLALACVERALDDADLPALVWYDVLLELERAGAQGLRPFELERRMLLAQYNVSRLLDRIATAGLIARSSCASDRRGQLLVITPKGRAVRRRMWPIYAAAIGQAFAAFDETQADSLGTLLEAVADGLQER